jgi:Flp pilus assembly protein TadG
MSRTSNERGLLSTELAILMPIVLLIAVLAVYVVSVERHSSRAQQAADAAARSASLMGNETDARSAAQAAAEAVCNGPVVITESNFSYVEPIANSFTPGLVAVGLTCTEQFSGFSPLVKDRARTESGMAVSVIEYWRASP